MRQALNIKGLTFEQSSSEAQGRDLTTSLITQQRPASIFDPAIIRLHYILRPLLPNLHPRARRRLQSLRHRNGHLLHHNHCIARRKHASNTRLIENRVYDLDMSTHRRIHCLNTQLVDEMLRPIYSDRAVHDKAKCYWITGLEFDRYAVLV